MILDPLFQGLNFKLSSEEFPRKNHIICFRDGNKTKPRNQKFDWQEEITSQSGKKRETQCAVLLLNII